jgi:hypothetical protein
MSTGLQCEPVSVPDSFSSIIQNSYTVKKALTLRAKVFKFRVFLV